MLLSPPCHQGSGEGKLSLKTLSKGKSTVLSLEQLTAPSLRPPIRGKNDSFSLSYALEVLPNQTHRAGTQQPP